MLLASENSSDHFLHLVEKALEVPGSSLFSNTLQSTCIKLVVVGNDYRSLFSGIRIDVPEFGMATGLAYLLVVPVVESADYVFAGKGRSAHSNQGAEASVTAVPSGSGR